MSTVGLPMPMGIDRLDRSAVDEPVVLSPAKASGVLERTLDAHREHVGQSRESLRLGRASCDGIEFADHVAGPVSSMSHADADGESIAVIPELRSLMPPVSADERRQLEDNLVGAGGARDPVVAAVVDGQRLLLDGQNRLEICTARALPYGIKVLDNVTNIAAAKEWIINNQLGRRNLTPEARSYLRGTHYNHVKGSRGGDHRAKPQDACLVLAEKYKLDKATIGQDGKFAHQLDELVEAHGAAVRHAVLDRDAGLRKSDVGRLAKMDVGQRQGVIDAILLRGVSFRAAVAEHTGSGPGVERDATDHRERVEFVNRVASRVRKLGNEVRQGLAAWNGVAAAERGSAAAAILKFEELEAALLKLNGILSDGGATAAQHDDALDGPVGAKPSDHRDVHPRHRPAERADVAAGPPPAAAGTMMKNGWNGLPWPADNLLRLPSGDVLPDAIVWENFCQDELGIDPEELWRQLLEIPTWPTDTPIPFRADGADPHWVRGQHEALNYRGRPIMRSKIWAQADFERGLRRYLYTGWQHDIAYATQALESVPPLDRFARALNVGLSCPRARVG